ncbi:ras GEF [Schizopora paradoxa]|uniref:Ras GEF n=1 Tax=Schizopora paradoxa TaxID=27342 RepID=A0A0H2REX5_9AGAM|nr:ras GEF [Schizopora paradoxa]
MRDILEEAAAHPIKSQNSSLMKAQIQIERVDERFHLHSLESLINGNDTDSFVRLSTAREEGALIHNPDGGVRAGTLSSLIETLTSYGHVDPIFSRTFLMTYKSFASPDEVLNLLFERYRMEPPAGLTKAEQEEWSKLKQHVIRSRVLNTLKSMVMVDDVLEDDRHVMDRVSSFLHEPDVAMSPGAKNLLATVERKRNGGWFSHIPPPIFPAGITNDESKDKLNLLKIDPLELARQLTLKESGCYRGIRPTDCLRHFGGRKSGKTDDCLTFILQLNKKVMNWVNASILAEVDVERRAAMLSHFISIGDCCRLLQNYSTMAAIVMALLSSPINRLKKTWNEIDGQTMSQLILCESVLDAPRNYATCRNTLASINPPCVPFLGVYLTSLSFIHNGIEDKLPGDLVNFGKQQRIADVIREILYWQTKDYDLGLLPPVMIFLEDTLASFDGDVVSEDQFHSLSLDREPSCGDYM